VNEREDSVETGSIGSADAGAVAAQEVVPAPRYMAVWAGLAALTALEVALAFMGFNRSATVIALLALAVWKALMVALYYMHLRWEPIPVRFVAAVPLVPAAILILLVLQEY